MNNFSLTCFLNTEILTWEVIDLGSECHRRIASKNLKKFMMIFRMNIHFHEFFQIFLRNRVLWRKSFLIVCFSRCFLNGKNEVSGSSTRRSNWTLSPYGIFFIIFFETTSNGKRIWKKWIWKIRNALMYMYVFSRFIVFFFGYFVFTKIFTLNHSHKIKDVVNVFFN